MGDRKAEALEAISRDGVIPILRTPTAGDALEIAKLLLQGGLASIEIPLTVPGALDAIAELVRGSSAGLHRCIAGAGTVLTMDQAHLAHLAGARFIVMPMFEPSIVAFCRTHDLACFPGALTPTEIVSAWTAGADAVKVFPISSMGGANYIKELKAPLPHIEVMPTGGVTVENAGAFISAGAFAVGVGAGLADVNALRTGNPQLISERAHALLDVVREARARRPQAPPPPSPMDSGGIKLGG